MATIKKAQKGVKVKATKDSSTYFQKKADSLFNSSNQKYLKGDKEGASKDAMGYVDANYDRNRQSRKGKPGYDKDGKSNIGRPGYDAFGLPKKKMKSGGKVVKKSAKKK
jgi:hypothetical protein